MVDTHTHSQSERETERAIYSKWNNIACGKLLDCLMLAHQFNAKMRAFFQLSTSFDTPRQKYMYICIYECVKEPERVGEGGTDKMKHSIGMN